MPTPNPTTRREYKEAAVATTLNGGINGTANSFVINDNSGWPTGAVGNFIVTIDRGLGTEERILCSAQSGKTVTVATSGRGFNTTTAQAHANNATVEHTGSAFDADEWNQHTNATGGVHGVTTVVGTVETQTLTNKTLNGAILDGASTLGGISGTILSGAWSTYTPTFANFTLGNGTTSGRYKQVGKRVTFTAYVSLGSTSSFGAGQLSVSIPVTSVNAGNSQYVLARYFNNVAASSALGYGEILNNSGTCSLWAPTSNTATKIDGFQGTVIGSAMTATGSFAVAGTYESA